MFLVTMDEVHGITEGIESSAPLLSDTCMRLYTSYGR